MFFFGADGHLTRRSAISRRRINVHRHFDFVLPAAEEHPAHRAHILKIAAEGNRDMLFLGDDIVRGIEVDPTPLRRPDRNPGMRGVRANELRLPLRRVGEQISADIAGGESERAQARDFEMCEILANSALDPQHLLNGGCRICCAGLVFEFAIDPRREVLHRLDEGAPLGKLGLANL